MNSDETGDGYQVGYRKPPCNGRFKPGVSGNPRGRPKKEAAPREPLALLNDVVPVRKDGTLRTMSAKELALRQQVKQALEENDVRSQLHLLRQFERYGLLKSGDSAEPEAGVLTLPSSMPSAMAMIAAITFGKPPWTKAQIAEARARYEKGRSDLEAQQDAAVGYPDLKEDLDHE